MLVVGAGPVGLTAACLLSAYALEVLIVERKATTSNEPKAISLDDESLRTLKLSRIGEEIDRIIVPGTGTQYHGARGQRLFRATTAEPLRFGHPFKNPFAQPALEAVLRDELERRDRVSMLFATELQKLRHTAKGVVADLFDLRTGEQCTVAAAFMIGCDGGRSTVRDLVGIDMAGRSYDEPWLVVDVCGDAHRERFGLHLGMPQRPTVIVPGAEGRCRYEFRLLPGEGVPGRPPDHAVIERLLAPYRTIAPDEVERAVIYRFNALIAQRWRERSVFLAGDAAHMMPPFAGQGLNSGIRDVANLCWKIAAVTEGRLSESALDSYERERRPNAEATVRLSERLGRIIFTARPFSAAVRDLVVRAAVLLPSTRRWLEEMRYRPSAQLDAGLVVQGTSRRVGTLLPQPPVFDIEAHRTVLLDKVLGRGWSLIGIATDDAEWELAMTAPLRRLVHALVSVGLDDISPVICAGREAVSDVDGRLQATFAASRGRFLLIRPDRVIAADFLAVDAPAVAEAVEQWQPEPSAALSATPLQTL